MSQDKKPEAPVFETEITVRRGWRKDIFLVLPNGERRHLFSICFMKGFPVIRHVPKSRYGAIADEVGIEKLQAMLVRMYKAIVQRQYNRKDPSSAWLGRYQVTLFTDKIDIKEYITVQQLYGKALPDNVATA